MLGLNDNNKLLLSLLLLLLLFPLLLLLTNWLLIIGYLSISVLYILFLYHNINILLYSKCIYYYANNYVYNGNDYDDVAYVICYNYIGFKYYFDVKDNAT